MTYNDIIQGIISYLSLRRSNVAKKSDIDQYLKNNLPGYDSRSLPEVIEEMDARGWVLKLDSATVEFDPAFLSARI